MTQDTSYHIPLDIYQLNELGYKIFLDRYAQKDPDGRQNLEIDDLVIAIIDNDSPDSRQRREVGLVLEIFDDGIVKLEVFPTGEIVELPIELIDRPLETTPAKLQKRVARGIASVENEKIRDKWQENFEWLLDDWKFVPGGRILTSAGTPQNLTAYNCFVLPSPEDSRGGIMKTLTTMAELMSRGGGVGINISTLRPKNAYVAGVNGRSSGSVSWGALYSFVTGLIEQAGSRRGALMLILNDWHPDLMRFINAKREAGKITNANISIGISDAFMEAVENDDDWRFKFPDTSHDAYNEEWDGDLESWVDKGYPIVVHGMMKAREIWDTIIESAWSSAEPGLWFRERTNKMSNSWYYPQGRLICTNPCGEEPLPSYGVCNLGAINLSKFWIDSVGDVNWEMLARTVHYATRFLDNVIDWTPYHIHENEKQQKSERRVGLGIMGLAELMLQAGIRYGSDESVEFTEQIFKFVAYHAYRTSADLAHEKGAFEWYEPALLKSGYMQQWKHDNSNIYPTGYNGKEHLRGSDVYAHVAEKGLRNVTLLTVAPTGTTGTMMDTSTGIEPFFSWSWWRNGRLGMHEESIGFVHDYMQATGIESYDDLPAHFVTAMDLSPNEHAKVQGAGQKWVDAAISKTVNAPEDYTIEQTSELYKYLYELGCKGGTIYRDNSRSEQVLTVKKDDEPAEEVTEKPQQPEPPAISSEIKLLMRPAVLSGRTFKGDTPFGTIYITVNEDPEGVPYEIFITIGKSGSDLQAQAESMGRVMSLSIQALPEQQRFSMLKILADQLQGIGGARMTGFGPKRVVSVPDAIGQLISKHYISPKEDRTITVEFTGDDKFLGEVTIEIDPSESVESASEIVSNMSMDGAVTKSIKGANICPECGEISFIRADGCAKCLYCGYSEC